MSSSTTSEPIMYRKNHGCKRFEGKNILVTAATAGIGLAICHRLASEGARLFICSRKQQNVDEAIKELTSLWSSKSTSSNSKPIVVGGIACNVSTPGHLEDYISKAIIFFGGAGSKIDGIVSNVGMNPAMGRALDMEEKTYDKIFDSNVRTHWRLLKLARPYLSQPGASIVLVSSTGGYAPSFPLGIYGVSKTALTGLGRALSTELGVDGIRVNTIAPGVVKTKLAEALWKSENGQTAANSSFLRRLGEPEDMAGTVAYLLSEDSRHVTGETIVLSGGSHHRL
jgi:dehydrogenase/reductase SDR family protein 4